MIINKNKKCFDNVGYCLKNDAVAGRALVRAQQAAGRLRLSAIEPW
jgi:hypothetical protein